jgi:hypothetical protein
MQSPPVRESLATAPTRSLSPSDAPNLTNLKAKLVYFQPSRVIKEYMIDSDTRDTLQPAFPKTTRPPLFIC